jgi:hypothetical protein
MSQKPLWKECVSAAIHTGVKAAAAFVPGATLVTDFCDKILSTREAETRHDEIVTRIGAIEHAVRGAFSQVCQRMTQPGLSLDQLDAIMHDLFKMRQANREPFLSQGMFANCVLYPDLLKNPNRYGRVLDYNATLHIEDEAFYLFLDIDKTRLLKMSHGQTMSLLAGQRNGIPASEVIGRANFFAQRTDTPASALPAQTLKASEGSGTRQAKAMQEDNRLAEATQLMDSCEFTKSIVVLKKLTADYPLDGLAMRMLSDCERFAAVMARASKANTNDRIFSHPTVPPKKLAGTVSKYARLGSGERPMVLYDSSDFGGGGAGYLITNSAVHGRDFLFGKGWRIPMGDFRRIEAQKGLWGTTLTVNQTHVVRLNMGNVELAVAILEAMTPKAM